MIEMIEMVPGAGNVTEVQEELGALQAGRKGGNRA